MGLRKRRGLIARLKFKIVIPILVVVVIVAAIVVIIKNMNGPVEGTVAYQNPNQVTIKPTQTTPGKYDGKYIAFSYPAYYKIVPSQKSIGYLDIISLNSTDHSGKYISIGVLPEFLDNDSGLNYRKAHPELYKQLSNLSGQTVFVGTQTNAEQTGFFARNSLVTTVSITANGHKDLSEDFNAIVNSLQWKQ